MSGLRGRILWNNRSSSDWWKQPDRLLDWRRCYRGPRLIRVRIGNIKEARPSLSIMSDSVHDGERQEQRAVPILGVWGEQERLSALVASAADRCEQAGGECEAPRGYRATSGKKQEARASQASSSDDGGRDSTQGATRQRKTQ